MTGGSWLNKMIKEEEGGCIEVNFIGYCLAGRYCLPGGLLIGVVHELQ
ncbi:MAG: hypothetical protein AB2L11_13310 [Syntrophobacteraceae bacterium]